MKGRGREKARGLSEGNKRGQKGVREIKGRKYQVKGGRGEVD